jgi:uncharacterized protein (DUF58 family)
MPFFSRIAGRSGKEVILFLLAGLGAVASFLLSWAARQQGQLPAATSLAVIALILAALTVIMAVPGLAASPGGVVGLKYYRLTYRGLFLLMLVAIITFSTFHSGNNLLILILSILVAFLLVSGVMSGLVLKGLKISLTLPDALHARQKAMFVVSLQNLKSLLPSLALRLKGRAKEDGDHEGTDFFTQEKRFPLVKAREKVSLQLHCRFERRGVYRVDGFEVKTTFPFGLFARIRELKAEGQIVVYPEIRDLGSLLSRFPLLEGRKERYLKGHSTSLYNIRNYQSGDDARFVHWKSTAKAAKLMIQDFASEEEQLLHLYFSSFLSDRSAVALDRFEKVVSVMASLIRHYYENQLPFSFDSGEFKVTSGEGKRKDEYESLMTYLARVQPAARLLLELNSIRPGSFLFLAGDVHHGTGVTSIDYLNL